MQSQIVLVLLAGTLPELPQTVGSIPAISKKVVICLSKLLQLLTPTAHAMFSTVVLSIKLLRGALKASILQIRGEPA